MTQHWPRNDRSHLANVHIATQVLGGDAPGIADEDGLMKLDLVLEHGIVADLLPAGSVTMTPSCSASKIVSKNPFSSASRTT